ncbi:hypothetical protein MIR68_004498 [Amoeboaphelidium protococcarum]|nr:hypothetical protein MIR68_004498 [Amoeboaphelidium protococcarum]
MMRLRVKDASGKQVILSLSQQSTMSELGQELLQNFGVPVEEQKIKMAVPPFTQIQIEGDQSIAGVIKSGDSLILERKSNSTSNATPQSSGGQTLSGVGSSIGGAGGVSKSSNSHKLRIRPIADDNSCLFNSIGYVLLNKDKSQASQLRQLIANTVLDHPQIYNSTFLGMDPMAYIGRIMDPQCWGGAIELSIFAKHFQTEIVSIDVETGVPYRFGEDSGYERRVFILYSGIHYDAIAQGWPGNEQLDVTIFPAQDDALLVEAIKVAEEERKGRRYTNTRTFTLKCGNCGKALVGESDAQSHAQSTGHVNFVEY